MTATAEEITKASYTAFVDHRAQSQRKLQPQIIANTKETRLLCDCLNSELRQADSFMFSVAFINQSGLEVLLQSLAEAEERGVKGRIITTDYLTFSEPQALKRLLSLSSFIETKVITGEGFHTKGYGFISGEQATIIIGSSNITQTALKTNREWNVYITSMNNGQYTADFIAAFEELWEKAIPLSYGWIREYEIRYREYHRKARLLRDQGEHIETYITKPNLMQRKATEALQLLRREGKRKALIIAATGTGKTYLSCFDVKAFNPKHMLYLVHRGQILEKTAESFEKILGSGICKDIGYLTGGRRETDRKYIFSTISTFAKEDVYRAFPPDFFDYIIIDEVHRAGAESYRRILDYFTPAFLLGMSATPDRTDHFNIYELFDYNIACDIRLQEALENDLLCPFHYFGISDIAVDGRQLEDKEAFSHLVSEERVDRIIEKARFYGHAGDRVKGLIFCSRTEEAEELSRLMNERGLRTAAVSGSTSIDERIRFSERLQAEEGSEALDYILSVDVMNEGVDLPKVNQIIMLRPTQSVIVFVQQLGRGLRKDPEKDFVIVLDFIANYDRNYLIPVALSGDTSYDKDNLRRISLEGTRMIPGCSTIDFDPIARDMIYRRIDNADFSQARFLKEKYLDLKNKLGRIPRISDFRKDNTIDIQLYVDKYGSYYSFLKKAEPDFKAALTEAQENMLVYISESFSSGKRRYELEFLAEVLEGELLQAAGKTAAYGMDGPLLHSISVNLACLFPKTADQRGKYSGCAIIDEQTGLLTDGFRRMLYDPAFCSELRDIVEDGLARYMEAYSNPYPGTSFVLSEKYTYEDVCRLLCWERSETPLNIGGYKYDKPTKTLPVFINYEKEPDAISYDDRFLSPSEIIAFSKKPRSIDSSDADHIYKRTPEDKDNRIYLFVRKNKDDGRKEFYFLGEIEAEGEPVPVQVDGKPAFEILYRLKTPVRSDIYDYLTSSV